MTHIPPHVLAAADQRNAHVDDLLSQLVANFRTHTAIHDGDTSCARGSLVLTFTLLGADPELLAAAVARIARDGP